METTYSHARQNLASLMDKVVDDCETVIIHRKGRPDVALIDAAELSSIQETLYLLSNRANARRLFDAMDSSERGEGVEMTVEELRQLIHAGVEQAS